jgi:protein gp37
MTGTRIIMIEPMLGPITLSKYLPVEWVVVGSETGANPRPIDTRWVSAVRDEVKAQGIPFFVKQLGTSHKQSIRVLDGREWNEFPRGFVK